MGQAFVIVIAIAVLLLGTFLFARLFRMHTNLERAWTTAVGFGVSLVIVLLIEAVYLSIGQW